MNYYLFFVTIFIACYKITYTPNLKKVEIPEKIYFDPTLLANYDTSEIKNWSENNPLKISISKLPIASFWWTDKINLYFKTEQSFTIKQGSSKNILEIWIRNKSNNSAVLKLIFEEKIISNEIRNCQGHITNSNNYSGFDTEYFIAEKNNGKNMILHLNNLSLQNGKKIEGNALLLNFGNQNEIVERDSICFKNGYSNIYADLSFLPIGEIKYRLQIIQNNLNSQIYEYHIFKLNYFHDISSFFSKRVTVIPEKNDYIIGSDNLATFINLTNLPKDSLEIKTLIRGSHTNIIQNISIFNEKDTTKIPIDLKEAYGEIEIRSYIYSKTSNENIWTFPIKVNIKIN